jgi:hypothetical protein
MATLWSPILSFAGAVVGVVLTQIISIVRSRQERRERLYETRIEVYAEWCALMEGYLQWYAGASKVLVDQHRLWVLRKKLELLEPHAKVRALLSQIDSTLPHQFSDDYQIMEYVAGSDPSFDWDPFRAKMEELMAAIRAASP